MALHGILNMYKPVGWTSHDVVGFVRRRLHEKRVGHAGTLDPAAEGVLPVAIGQATRVLEFLEGRKSYVADVMLGVTTDTYDREGVVTSVQSVPDFSLTDIEAALSGFRGRISQTPPAYSALKIDGQPLYKAARVAGDEDAVAAVAALAESKRREINIYRLDLTHWLPPDGLTIEVDCSKGTYIRSLIYDLGQKLGVGAYMAHLVRTAAGPFTIDDAITPDDLALAVEFDYLDKVLLPIDAALTDWPAWIVNSAGETALRQGKDVQNQRAGVQTEPAANDVATVIETWRRVYTADGTLLGLLERAGERWHPAKIFSYT